MSMKVGGIYAELNAKQGNFVKTLQDSARRVRNFGQESNRSFSQSEIRVKSYEDRLKALDRTKQTLQDRLKRLNQDQTKNAFAISTTQNRIAGLDDRMQTLRMRMQNARTETKSFQERLQGGFQKALTSTQTILTNLATHVIAGLLLGAIRKAISAFVDFAKSAVTNGFEYRRALEMIEVSAQATGEGTEEQMNRIRKSTIEIGKQTKFSAGEVADAYRMWQRNGRELEEGLNGGIEAALKFAQITRTDLSESVDFATDIVALYGDRIGDTNDLIQILVGTTEASKHGGEEIQNVFRRTAVSASKFGDDIGKLGGLISITAQNFDSAEEQGTSLRMMLERLQTGVARDELRKLGIETRDSQGQMRNYMDIMGDLTRRVNDVGGVGTQAGSDIIRAVFGNERDRRGAEATIRNFENLDEAMQKIANAPVDKLLDASMTPMERLSSIIDTLQIQFSELEFGGTKVIDIIGEGFRIFGETLEWAFGKLQPILDKLSDLSDRIMPILNEHFGRMWDNLAPIREVFSALGESILPAFNKLLDWWVDWYLPLILDYWNKIVVIFMEHVWPALQDLGDAFMELFDAMGFSQEGTEGLIETLLQLSIGFIKISAIILGAVIKALAEFIRFIIWLGEGIGGFISDAIDQWNYFKDYVSAVINGDIKGALDALSNMIKNAFKIDLYQAGRDMIQGLINGILSMDNPLGNVMRNMGLNALGNFKATLGIQSPAKEFMEPGQDIVRGAVEGIKQQEYQFMDVLASMGMGGLDAFARPVDNSQTNSQTSNITNNNSFNVSGGNPDAILQKIQNYFERMQNQADQGFNLSYR